MSIDNRVGKILLPFNMDMDLFLLSFVFVFILRRTHNIFFFRLIKCGAARFSANIVFSFTFFYHSLRFGLPFLCAFVMNDFQNMVILYQQQPEKCLEFLLIFCFTWQMYLSGFLRSGVMYRSRRLLLAQIQRFDWQEKTTWKLKRFCFFFLIRRLNSTTEVATAGRDFFYIANVIVDAYKDKWFQWSINRFWCKSWKIRPKISSKIIVDGNI